MKFEKLSDSKFAAFEKCALPNLKGIFGGTTDTDGTGTHDEAETWQSPNDLDDITTSVNGTTISSDTSNNDSH